MSARARVRSLPASIHGLVASLAFLAPGLQDDWVREWLVVSAVDAGGRRPFRPDAVFARHLLDRASAPPEVGQSIQGELGKAQTWRAVRAGADGALPGEIGWAYSRVDSETPRIVMARLSGAARLFVNGAGFVGDSYGYGFQGVPVALRAGRNDVYVGGVRGAPRLALAALAGDVVFADEDLTRPDVPAGDAPARLGPLGPLVWNASDSARWIAGRLAPDEGSGLAARDFRARVPPLAPWKACVELDARTLAARAPGAASVGLTLSFGADSALASVRRRVELEVRAEGAARRVTFRSGIDGSAQFLALVPPAPGAGAGTGTVASRGTKLVLSLHGASVDALAQARAYAPKPDLAIACPTNRRPFGFDWQDWGRLDAYEALDVALAELGLASETTAVCLTGHSMGGHGTWHLAANDPGRFAAIAPSAGWSSFDSYGGRPRGELAWLWHAADGASDTLASILNLAPIPTYVLHGTSDDNVPASEAKAMQQALEDAGGRPTVHFQGGAGHWWDGEAAAGADCVDWPGIFELFARAPLRTPAAELDFTTADPGIQSRLGWIEITEPGRYGQRSSVRTRLHADHSELLITTDNVRRLACAALPPDFTGAHVVLDGTRIAGADARRARAFVRDADAWRVESSIPPGLKTPGFSGPFKSAFDHEFVLVYGTAGTPEEDRELLERARHDLEVWWYRANATVPLLSDGEYLDSGSEYSGRSAILYGNSDTNAAFVHVFGPECPVSARRGVLRLGSREWKSDALGAVFCYPARVAGQPGASAAPRVCAAFLDTGVAGARLGYQLAPWVSGVGYPDYAVFSADVLGAGDGGVLAAGWFDHAWRLDDSGFAR